MPRFLVETLGIQHNAVLKRIRSLWLNYFDCLKSRDCVEDFYYEKSNATAVIGGLQQRCARNGEQKSPLGELCQFKQKQERVWKIGSKAEVCGV